jgi:hypothetical protein
VSDFKDAIGWRGPDRLSFIVYGLWRAGGDHLAEMERARVALADVVPGSEVSLFVATDEGWPCNVGVFDIELADWPENVEGACNELLMAVCRERSEIVWMMFDGVFNDVEDIFHPQWAAHIYAIRADCDSPQADLAIADEERHSARWAHLVAKYRAQVLNLFPTLEART